MPLEPLCSKVNRVEDGKVDEDVEESPDGRRFVVFLDLDGTLLNTVLTVGKETQEVLRIAESIADFVLCSGRPLVSCRLMAEKLFAAPKYIISTGGGVIYDCVSDSLLRVTYFEDEVALELASIGQASSAATCIYQPRMWYAARQDRTAVEETGRSGATPIWIDDLRNVINGVVKVLFILDPTRVQALRASLLETGLPIHMFSSHPEYLEVLPIGSNKGSAVRCVMERFHGDSMSITTVGIGNGLADVAMFEMVDVSVAVANSDETALASATYIAPSNDDSGAAVAIRGIVLNEKWAIGQLRRY